MAKKKKGKGKGRGWHGDSAGHAAAARKKGRKRKFAEGYKKFRGIQKTTVTVGQITKSGKLSMSSKSAKAEARKYARRYSMGRINQ